MKTINYRKCLKKPGKSFLLLCLYVILFMAGLTLSKIFTIPKNGRIPMIIMIGILTLVLVLVLFIEFILMYYILLSRFKLVKLSIDNKKLMYDNLLGKTEINYAEIKSIYFPSGIFMDNTIKIKGNKRIIKLSSFFDGMGDFLDELQKKLDQKSLSSVYKKEKLEKFKKKMTIRDRRWKSFYDKVKIISISVLICTVLCSLISFISLKDSHLYLKAAILIIYPFIVFFISEKILSLFSFDNKKEEKNTYLITSFIAAVLIIIFIIFV
ncbi:hypothetical protein [Clostridium sp. BJN0001]|uniref:hypothetical protein n=1 Tax=Clostridium sp. BJN0001 TaxID=2930219 RepID=UPI001FD35C4D|nr:hypothetical protein [Clostridium sp. BJN0001]